MATAYIAEFRDLAYDQHGHPVPVGSCPPLAEQVVTFTASTQSTAFHSDTRFVRISADANCNLAFGSAPTATASNMEMQADTPEYFGVNGKDKVAIYDGTS